MRETLFDIVFALVNRYKLGKHELIVQIQEPSLLSPPTDKHGRLQNALLLGFIVVGAGLRFWQYLANTSLWVDEIFLATNILHRSLWQLLTVPLDYGQVAPKGFLLVENLLTAYFGPSDLVLRLFPFLCSLGGLVGFAGLVRRLLNSLAAIIAVALFAAAPPLVAYTTQVKQYSSDVAIAVLLLWVAAVLAATRVSPGTSLGAGVIGAVAVWLSQPAIFMVVGLSVSLVLIAWWEAVDINGRNILALLPSLLMWNISALGAAIVSLASMTPHVRDFMHEYWKAGFLPSPAWRAIEMRWPWRQLQALIGLGGQASLGYPFPRFYLILAAP